VTHGDVVGRGDDLGRLLGGYLRAQFVVGTHAVAADAGLADEHPLVVGDVVEPLEVGLRRVYRRGVRDEVRVGPLLVGQELVDDLPAGLTDRDECEFHGIPCGVLATRTRMILRHK